jgi:uncharacterized membrane protein YuzA (DUF378 family)
MMYLITMLLSQGQMPVVDPQASMDALVGGFSATEWAVIVGAIGNLVVWLLRYLLLPNLSGKALGWVASILVGLAAAGTALISNPAQWLQAILAGFGAALAAMGSWQLLKQTVVGKGMVKAVKKRQ